ncbi:MAG: PepSY domain-containing protein, partial [Johnsonella sp.]|nr:PepSY domain-containing protein [Johnsonella sp.]
MKKLYIKKTTMAAMLGLTGLLFTACANVDKAAQMTTAAIESTTEAASIAEMVNAASTVYGSLHLSVNPEIEIGYDEKGNVIHVHGLNEEGKRIVSSSTSYLGRPSEVVAKELVKAIYEGGYFKNRFEGQDKNIVFKLEKGSKLPSENFLDELADEVEDAVRTSGLSSATIIVNEADLNQQGMISSTKAREIALAQVGIKDAVFTEDQYDLDDGVYELEFTHNGVEYEYELDARTGKVRKADYDKNDDWDTQDLDDDL